MDKTKPMIQVENVTKKFSKDQAPSVDNVSFTAYAGEFVTILGTSGSGKTTLMKMINRLYEPTSGQIFVDGQNTHAQNVDKLRQGIGYVIQQHGLFEHRTVAQNIATVCNILKWDKRKTQKRVDEMLTLVQLEPDKYKGRHPHQLSGGEQQRVGIARALAADPKILLMDEPFGAIDAINRTLLQNALLNIQRQTQKTIIFVTHDIDEALKLGDRTMLIKDGRIQQFASKNELFLKPSNDFVAEFLGVKQRLAQWRYLNAGALVTDWQAAQSDAAAAVSADTILADVIAILLKNPERPVTVLDKDKARVGHIHYQQIANLMEA
ncbi:MAG: ABC transporter ATP-binding protein [Lactobacillus sp.]|jgi:osmoprotectant transport system ATP-binding protein|nr:ABC transporter ATP-binding protein [Lactobacillus sp.]